MHRVLSFDIGIKNLAFCDFEIDVHQPDNVFMLGFHAWQILDVSAPTKKYDLNQTTSSLLEKLMHHFDSIDPYTHILIENQPALVNPIMKSIQMIIFTFFHMKKMEIGKNNATNILLVSASNKTKKLLTTFLFCQDEEAHNQNKFLLESKKPKYIINKAMSQYLCEKIIQDKEKFPVDQNNNDHLKMVYFSNKKKDDLADAFLQGLAYIL